MFSAHREQIFAQASQAILDDTEHEEIAKDLTTCESIRKIFITLYNDGAIAVSTALHSDLQLLSALLLIKHRHVSHDGDWYLLTEKGARVVNIFISPQKKKGA